jgi:hypothetical protein
MRRPTKHGAFFTIFQPLLMIILCLLLPSAILLALTMYYKVNSGNSLFATSKSETNNHILYVDFSATSLTNISSVSSTLAPFVIGMLMGIWNPYVARAILEGSREDLKTSQPLPTPFQFSLLANMRAGRCDQLWKYFSSYWRTSRAKPSILRQTTIILFSSFVVTFLTFLGDQFFHIWSKSLIIARYTVPSNRSSFGRGLTSECIHFNRTNNHGWPCTRSSYDFISKQEFAEREQELSYLSANTSKLSQIQFLKVADLHEGDLAVLYPGTGVVPSYVDYHASTLGVSTQCQFMTPTCHIKYISDILTQFNCSETFFGVLGKPANISFDMESKAQDPDVPGLAWKISPSLEYAFYSDGKLQVPYNVMGWNPLTGNGDPDLPLLPDSKLVNPVFLSVAGRITGGDMAIGGNLAAESSSQLFLPTYDGYVFDFFLNCSYTTYDVEYTIIKGTTQPDFTFIPTLNGSVSEEWHGRQQYVSLNGDPSDGLTNSNLIAAKQKTPDDFARTWANLYSVRVLAVIGAYTNPRLNIQEQMRDQILVTRIVPWTLGFLLAANFTYVLLGLVVSAISWAVATKEVLQVSENMDLNKQITERYGGVEMSRFGNESEQTSVAGVLKGNDADSGLRVGIIGSKFESIYYAV